MLDSFSINWGSMRMYEDIYSSKDTSDQWMVSGISTSLFTFWHPGWSMHLMSDALMKEAMEVQESHHFGQQRHKTEHAYLSILTLASYIYIFICISIYVYIYQYIYFLYINICVYPSTYIYISIYLYKWRERFVSGWLSTHPMNQWRLVRSEVLL